MLFEPLLIRSLTLRNRIVISPMCQYSSVDGFANDWHLVHLGSRAAGGAALIIQEATAVSPEGRITPDDMGLWKDEHISFLKKITTFIKSQGAIPGIQLAHAGRKASTLSPWKGGHPIPPNAPGGWQPFAPSPLAFRPEYPVPKVLELHDIIQLKNDFIAAAHRAVRAGYEVLEIHAAHGYLIHSFLSPLSNHRNDAYGGSFENRIRLLVEIVSDLRKIWPSNFPLFVRISANDYAVGGWNIEESVRLAIHLKEIGVDLIDVSSGGLLPGIKIPLGPGYQVHFSERIRREAAIATGSVGLITEAAHADDIIRSGQSDLILIARESLRDPNFPLTAAAILKTDIPWPLQYERAKK